VSAIFLILSGPIARDAVPSLLERVRMVLEEGEGDLIVCDVGALDDPDADTLDLLCRLQLTAKRLGRRVLLRDACGELRDLLAWTGLTEVMPCV
jgi:ABC-type transporter Mla MlaB component